MGYAPISKDKVIKACEDYLKRRKERITKGREALIKAEMSRKWFPAKTKEIAIRRMERDRWHEYNWVHCAGGYWADKVRELLNLAKAADNNVYVSGDVAEILSWEG